jgi:hypothetical protein
MADKYLEINLLFHGNPKVSNAIIYVLLSLDEHGWEKADNLRILATGLIEKAGLASHLPAGAMEIPKQRHLWRGDDPWAHGSLDVFRVRCIKRESPEMEDVLAEILINVLTEWKLRHPSQLLSSSNFDEVLLRALDEFISRHRDEL